MDRLHELPITELVLSLLRVGERIVHPFANRIHPEFVSAVREQQNNRWLMRRGKGQSKQALRSSSINFEPMVMLRLESGEFAGSIRSLATEVECRKS